MTFYYTNQQRARLMFYHDHAWGITRLNVYAGEAAGYLISDDTEQALIDSGTIPEPRTQIPLVIQDRTFVPDAAQLALQDPTWDPPTAGAAMGNFWYHHVYMPAQNPSDPSGMSAYGRWMYGPWFWPPATPPHGPIDNPYYDKDPDTNFTTTWPACNLDDPTTWQYDTDPFCEPPQIPGTPKLSAGHGAVQRHADRQRHRLPDGHPGTEVVPAPDPQRGQRPVLQLPVVRRRCHHREHGRQRLGEVIGGTEVALKPAELAAAQTRPGRLPDPAT